MKEERYFLAAIAVGVLVGMTIAGGIFTGWDLTEHQRGREEATFYTSSEAGCDHAAASVLLVEAGPGAAGAESGRTLGGDR